MYDPQPIQQKDKVQAWTWYEKHQNHVDRMIDELGLGSEYSSKGYPPCGSDCIRPELWKPNHWKWLLETCASVERSRTLVRVVDVGEAACHVVVPGFGYDELITLRKDQVPPGIWDLFEPDKRLHARVNIGAENAEGLMFSDWERK